MSDTGSKDEPRDPETTDAEGVTGSNATAIEAISERLTEVTNLSEELDQTLRNAQQDCAILTTANTSTTVSHTIPITIITSTKHWPERSPHVSEEYPSTSRPPRPEDLKSDEEFQTASECTLQHSRSSSYNTASECEHVYAPWWDYGKDDLHDDISKEKMVLAVGLPELPQPKTVLKPSPEVPPGKIVREVTETTHYKVQQSHSMGVQSFVLTSETVRDKKNEVSTRKEETIRVLDESGQEITSGVRVDADNEDFERRVKEVGEDEAWKKYSSVTKHALRGFF